jgi:hypothetical protein
LSPHSPVFSLAVSPGTTSRNFLAVHKLDGKGYFFGGVMRRSRWESLERSVKEAEDALREKKKAV